MALFLEHSQRNHGDLFINSWAEWVNTYTHIHTTLLFPATEVLLDPCRTWCPSSSCQAVCQLKEADSARPQLVRCGNCKLEFCSACKASWHPGQECQENPPITAFLPGESRYLLVTSSQASFTRLSHISSCFLLFHAHMRASD